MRGRVSESGGENWEGAMIQFRIPQNYHKRSRCTATPHPDRLLSDTQRRTQATTMDLTSTTSALFLAYTFLFWF